MKLPPSVVPPGEPDVVKAGPLLPALETNIVPVSLTTLSLRRSQNEPTLAL